MCDLERFHLRTAVQVKMKVTLDGAIDTAEDISVISLLMSVVLPVRDEHVSVLVKTVPKLTLSIFSKKLCLVKISEGLNDKLRIHETYQYFNT